MNNENKEISLTILNTVKTLHLMLELNPTQPIDPETFSLILNSVLNLNQNKYLHQVEAYGLT